MEFFITIRTGSRDHRLQVKLIFKDPRVERFRVIGRDKSIVVETNRPLFRNRGLKHRKPDWKLIEGDVMYPQNLEDLYRGIMKHIESVD